MRLLSITILVFLLQGCITPFTPETAKYEKILVVDALLTNDKHEYPRVKLTESFKTDDIKPRRVSEATIRLFLENGIYLSYTEISKGSGIYKYYGDKGLFVIGGKYKLQIEYNGDVFESNFETMLPVAEITSVDYTQSETEDDSFVQLYVSTRGTEQQSRYYSWNYVETWEVGVQYYFEKYKDKQRCFPSEKREGLIVGTTEQNVANELSRHPLYSASISSGKFQKQYSTQIKQYSISRDTYVYLKHLINQKVLVGSLFDPLPSALYGNLRCVSNEDVPVLGNFQVSAVTSQRLFIPKGDLHFTFVQPVGLVGCDLRYEFIDNYDNINELYSKGFSFVDTAYNLDGTPRSIAMSNFARCYNCNADGSPNVMPDWWVDN